MNGSAHVKITYNPRWTWISILMGMALAATSTLLPAQVSLATVVDLAQRNSGAVKMAEADVNKAAAVLSETKDVFIPSLMFGSGLPALPSVGFTGGVPSIGSATVQSLAFSLPQKYYVDAARAGLKAASLNLKEAREQAALESSVVYLEMDTVNREREATGQQEEFAKRLVEIEQERAEAGVDPLSDLLDVQLTLAQLKLKRLHLETRAGTLAKQLAALTGLPSGSITPDRSSIPEIPQVHGDQTPRNLGGVQAALLLATAKKDTARGDSIYEFLPQISLNALYLRSTKLLNDADNYYKNPIPTNNFSSGFNVQIPIFDVGHRAKARESAADALRAKVEAEQAQRQSEIQIAELTGSLRELDTLAEIASLKQQIANAQLKTVAAQLELGNGSSSGPGAQPQLTPKADQLARIDERQKFTDALDAGFDLSKARLNLLRALGHMEDWLHQLHSK